MSNAAAALTTESLPYAKALSLAEQAAPTEPAPPLVILESCDACDGLGVIDWALPHQHPIERSCLACDGTGHAPIETFDADDNEARIVHTWFSEQAYSRDEAAMCGANPFEDVADHEVGRYAHCETCLAAKNALVSP